MSQPFERRGGGNVSIDSKIIIFVVKLTFVVLLCGSSYLAGSIWGRHSLEMSSTAPMSVGSLIHGPGVSGGDVDSGMDCEKVRRELINSEVKKELEKHMNELKSPASPVENNDSHAATPRFPQQMQRFANGMTRVKKDDLNEYFDFGNPMDPGKGTGEEDAIILYHNKKSLPNDKKLAYSAEYDDGKGIPMTDPETATENCDSMNVVFIGNPGNTRQCTAIIGNFESYHIQRWMRANDKGIDPSLPLEHKSRGIASNGRSNFYAPPFNNQYTKKHWSMLRTFLENVDSVLDELKPILKKVSRNNSVVILTCNHGQSALLVNFACSATRRGFDLGNILVFPSDLETKELAEGLGLTTYYDEKNMGPLPSGEARRYGDKTFKAMMYAKVLCVLYPLLLDYDVLFQDVDIVWYKNPMTFFHNETSDAFKFDVIFQHDGSNSVRYAPYSANSGFYYVRANKKTQYLFTSLLYHSDLILTWDSHQQALVQLLAEHSSLFGLNVKVYNRDTSMFPGGWQFHRKHSFMKELVKGKTDSYIFHMSWTENKDNKLLFLRQLGEWYVNDACVGTTVHEILGGESSSVGVAPLVEPCCAIEPLFSCHYRDKPSKLPCKTSPPIDTNGKSFW